MNASTTPKWLRVASWLAVLWMLSGTAAFVMDLLTDEAALAQMSPGQRELYESRPQWLFAAYAIAIASGLAGAVALVLRKAWAVPALALSLAAVAIQFGYLILGLQAIERVGAVDALLPPIFIFAMGALVLWLAMHAKKRLILVALILVALAPLVAQEPIDEDVYWKIRQEGTTRSSILHSVHVLADRFSPRLTGSPGLKAAGEWAIDQMRAWGLQNGRLEPWDFNRPGWTNERLTAHIVSPVKDALVVEALGWTPGTNGVVRGTAIGITPPQRATRSEYTAYLDTIKPRVARAMVLVGIPRQVQVTFNQPALRREDAEVATQMAPAQPAAARGGGPSPQQQQTPQQGRGQAQTPQADRPLTAAEMDNLLNEFLVANGAVVRVNDAGRDHGQIRAFNNRTYDPAKSPPTVVMRNEDYGRIWRLMNGSPAPRDDVRARAASPAPVELEFEVVNRLHPEGRTSYNALAEIPGGDKADEIVMLGAHLDAWHAGTGATDNAVGCAVMMEAARILTAVGVKPRRTIRVALWSGEEQGLYGSQAHVREQFGTVEEPKPAFGKFAGYVNMDTGTGRVRGMTVFGPAEAATILRQAAAPFADLGVIGATSTTSRARGSSDHSSFNWAGLPGINLLQDPIEYSSYTWHTNLDTYERIVEDDVKKTAIVVAGLVYHLAMRDEPLPRLSREQMPRRPATQND